MIPRAMLFPLALFVASVDPMALAETQFLRGMEDFPLAPGLAEVPGAAFLFSTSAGRIEEAVARGKTTDAALRAYYRLALPPLGWTPVSDAAAMTFDRGRDRVTLKVQPGKDGVVTLQVRLVSRPVSEALD